MFRRSGTKYNARKTLVGGIMFDSNAEANMYMVLKQWQKQGKIRDLKTQVEFILQPGYRSNGKAVRPIKYLADFTFFDIKQNRYRIIDCKGMRTPAYLLKKKMFGYINLGQALLIEESLWRQYCTCYYLSFGWFIPPCI